MTREAELRTWRLLRDRARKRAAAAESEKDRFVALMVLAAAEIALSRMAG